jgi:hypothetical protein
MIRYRYSESPVSYDDEDFTWIRIEEFPLPEHFQQKTSRLLLYLPGVHRPVTIPPLSFYLDSNLVTADGRTPAHVFNDASRHEALDLTHQGYAYYCLLIPVWRPTADVVSGDTLVGVTNRIRIELSKA